MFFKIILTAQPHTLHTYLDTFLNSTFSCNIYFYILTTQSKKTVSSLSTVFFYVNKYEIKAHFDVLFLFSLKGGEFFETKDGITICWSRI